jgi:hypothetical protein
MSSRLRLLVSLLVLLSLTSAASADRRRAVRAKTPDCSFSVAAAFADPITGSGMIRGVLNVTGSSPGCTSWAAYSDVSWVTIEQNGSVAYVSVLPNESQDPRFARIRVAGVLFQLNQLQADGPISPPTSTNLLANGTFDTNTASWGWLDRFPNGTGDASWSPLDANDSPSSGSFRIRDTLDSSNAYQQLQCVNVDGAATYAFGAAVRSSSRDGAHPVFALVQYDAPNCAGNYPPYRAIDIRVAAADVWERRNYTQNVTETAKSISLIVSTWARAAGNQQVWYDDVYLRVAP